MEQPITHEIRKGDELLVFENVPAFVCAQCDGVWISGDVKRKLDEIVSKEAGRG